MKGLSPAAVREAAEVLGVAGGASLAEIRDRYHRLIKEHHPDVRPEGDTAAHETTVVLTAAYRLLVRYCTNYRFSFAPEDIAASVGTTPQEYWREHFGDDPIWG
jgi:preprotein translocase subunit Sec63